MKIFKCFKIIILLSLLNGCRSNLHKNSMNRIDPMDEKRHLNERIWVEKGKIEFKKLFNGFIRNCTDKYIYKDIKQLIIDYLDNTKISSLLLKKISINAFKKFKFWLVHAHSGRNIRLRNKSSLVNKLLNLNLQYDNFIHTQPQPFLCKLNTLNKQEKEMIFLEKCIKFLKVQFLANINIEIELNYGGTYQADGIACLFDLKKSIKVRPHMIKFELINNKKEKITVGFSSIKRLKVKNISFPFSSLKKMKYVPNSNKKNKIIRLIKNRFF